MNAQPETLLLCSQCGGTFYSSASFCCFDGSELLYCQPSKGAGLFGDASPATGKQCKSCGMKYPVLLNYCGVDGAELVTWFDAPPEEPKEETQRTAVPPRVAHSYAPTVLEEIPVAPAVTNTEAYIPALIGKPLDGKYLIESLFAEGGMAILYKAKQTSIDRTVLVKVMRESAFSDEDLQRFEREAKLLAKLNHPNIVSVYDFGFLNKTTPFLVMEHIRGGNLAYRVHQFGQPGLTEALQIMIQTCQGLQEAHKYGIVHRDLKPENIILHDDSTRPDWVKIVDFGIAHALSQDTKRLTKAGMMIGTPAFMAPELFNEREPDQRCDIYSLGVLMFELITGRLPFQAGDVGSLIAKIVTEQVPSFTSIRSDIPPGTALEETVRKCLQRNPDDRYASASELLKVLQELHRTAAT